MALLLYRQILLLCSLKKHSINTAMTRVKSVTIKAGDNPLNNISNTFFGLGVNENIFF
tara:strand:- start:142 stop:315 length:174 start_codon:yes stop_codon:yes gene_type:complete